MFGVATTVASIHRMLPHPVSKNLHIEMFSGQKSTQLLNSLVEAVTLDTSICFKLGGNALDRLLEIFTYNDFSVKRFLSGYKVGLPAYSCFARALCSTVATSVRFR